MKNKTLLKKYYNQSNKIFGSILMIGLMILLVGFSYAFFVYNKTGLYTHTIIGGKMSIIYNETTGNNITIDNAYPLTNEEALTKGLEFEFTITGYNESDKNIYYAIEMDYGEDVADKERFLDSDMKLSLYENDEEVFENEIFNNLDNQNIHYGMINYGTSSESPVTNNYKLRIWINDYVIISDTISNDLSTWTDFEWDFLEDYNLNIYNSIMDSDSQYLSDFGISIYTTTEFANRYANFKVNVKADLTYDDVDFITYDANGGSFTPSKTSLTTGRVTTQKPIMIVESSQTGNSLNGKVTQIDNENEYVYKGFLGWSSTPNGEVEYKAGDYYSGDGKMLYAVYGDTVNKMVEYWPDELNALKANITNVAFINDIQSNIDNNYNNAELKWDLSYDGSGSVKSWIEIDETNSIATLYIGSEGTIYLTNGYGLFADWYNLVDISFDNVDTSMVTDMSYMFSMNLNGNSSEMSYNDSNSLTTQIDNELYVEPVTCGPEYVPYNNLTYLDLTSFNTINVVNMSGMFMTQISNDPCGDFGESHLEYINLDSFDTSNVEDMSYMFTGQMELKSIDLSNFDTSKVTNMEGLFAYCDNIRELDLSNFNTSSVTNMMAMFYNCYELISLNVSSFDTSLVTNMSSMFYNCNLKELDLTNFNTENVQEISYMFWGCSQLKVIYANSDWNNGNVLNSTDMFRGCFELVGAISYNYNDDDITMANPDTGYFARKTA